MVFDIIFNTLDNVNARVKSETKSSMGWTRDEGFQIFIVELIFEPHIIIVMFTKQPHNFIVTRLIFLSYIIIFMQQYINQEQII